MLYLSQLLGTSVEDQQNVRLGKIVDVLVHAEDVGRSEATYPGALLVEGEEDPPWQIPVTAVEWRDDLLHASSVTRQKPLPQEICLVRDVLDKQIIDIVRKKTIRVNDVCFADDWQLLGIDNSNLGLIRRIAPAWLLRRGRTVPTNLISWARVELIGVPTELSTPTVHTPSRPLSGHLADLHPADIAQIVHQLTPAQGAHLIEGLDNKTAADTMEEIDTDLQRDILANIQPARAVVILQEMEPDEVADLLARLPEEQAQDLLHLLNPEESEDVQDLLEYAADTAGGLMTTAYVVLNQTRTAAEALEAVRNNIRENDIRLSYVYCVADETLDESKVLGVVSLWELLVAPPAQPLQEFMETDITSVSPDSNAHEVAEIMAKYNLLAIPVIDEQGVLAGVVTIDDAIDVLLPSERRRRPSSMY